MVLQHTSLPAASPPLLPFEYLLDENEVGDNTEQDSLLRYLRDVLGWMFRAPHWHVARNIALVHPAIANSKATIVPDIVVFLNIPLTSRERGSLAQWDMRKTPGRPCPPVVIEVSSLSTWQSDVAPQHKPRLYGQIGVREYIAYDPQNLWRGQGDHQLLGWRYDAEGHAQPIAPDAQGLLWSEQLQSWLAPDGGMLRLYDNAGQLRLTAAEARDTARQQQTERAARARATG